MFQDHALFPHRDVARQRRVRPAHAATAARRDRGARRARRSPWSGSPGSSTGGRRAVGRRAAARRARPRAGAGAAAAMLDEPLGALDRALRDRLVAELRALFVAPRAHDRVRHPRPRRGVRARRPGRGHARGPHRAGRAARSRCGSTRPTRSSPASSAGTSPARSATAGRGAGRRPRSGRPVTGRSPASSRPERFAATTSCSRSRSTGRGRATSALEVAVHHRTRARLPATPVHGALAPDARAVPREQAECSHRGEDADPGLVRHSARLLDSRARQMRRSSASRSAPNLHTSGRHPRNCPYPGRRCRLLRRRSPARSSSSKTKHPIADAWPRGLRSEGFEVTIAADGPAGVELCDGSIPTSSCST